ncbi:MAG: efflux transporter outer membrane subunit [Verrucomicrobia bacterium]|nr:efflux transporter outer membrane subunit [Verrucomicrobiota bacterium]
MSRSYSTFSLCLASLCLCACGLLPPLGTKRMKTDVAKLREVAPEKWAALPSLQSGAATGWLADFSSPTLNRFVERAIAANPNLKAASARVTQARAETVKAGADMLPSISTNFSSSRTQAPGDQRFAGLGQINNRFRFPLNVSWEIDFWGRVADQRGSAKARRFAAEEDFHAARLSLAANTVRTAITLAEAQALLTLAEQNVQTRRVQLGILDRQMARGLDPDRAALDLSLSRADLARAESTIQQRRANVDQTRRALEVLMGGYPAGSERGLSSLPSLRRDIPAGLPSELLLRRPDLRAAERRLEAALRTESAAKKAFLPSIRLTGESGRTSQDIDDLLDPQAAIWSVASNITQSLFQGGRIMATAQQTRARYEEQLQTYTNSALTAFREVETALAADGFLKQQAAALSQAAAEAERAESLAQGQYEKGLSEVLTLLDTRQRAFDARSSLITVQALRLRNRADLHLALGGEF